MNPLNQVNIEEVSTEYNIKLRYFSERKNKDYDAVIKGIEEVDGKVTLQAEHGGHSCNEFEFIHSDPDRVIAIAQMILAFAQMVKNNKSRTQSDTN